MGRVRMQLPGVHIECLYPPMMYSLVQLERAITVAWALQRGRFVLAETPALRDKP